MNRSCIDFPGVNGVAVCFTRDPGTGSVARIEFVVAGLDDDRCTACKQHDRAAPCAGGEADDVAGQVKIFLEGRGTLDRAGLLARCASPTRDPGTFRARAVEALLALPRGETTTYGRLAAMAGNPRAARAAGAAMRANPLPVIVPCHKVVAATGPGGFAGNRHPALAAVKRRLLDLDGCMLP